MALLAASKDLRTGLEVQLFFRNLVHPLALIGHPLTKGSFVKNIDVAIHLGVASTTVFRAEPRVSLRVIFWPRDGLRIWIARRLAGLASWEVALKPRVGVATRNDVTLHAEVWNVKRMKDIARTQYQPHGATRWDVQVVAHCTIWVLEAPCPLLRGDLDIKRILWRGVDVQVTAETNHKDADHNDGWNDRPSDLQRRVVSRVIGTKLIAGAVAILDHKPHHQSDHQRKEHVANPIDHVQGVIDALRNGGCTNGHPEGRGSWLGGAGLRESRKRGNLRGGVSEDLMGHGHSVRLYRVIVR